MAKTIVDDAKRDGLQAVHRCRDGEPRRGTPPKASASCSRATASRPRRWASRSGPTWTRSSSGTNPVGLPIYFDKNAYEADGIVLPNRVKPHTDFHATYESGILKMLVIGLGKRRGGQPGA